MNPTKLAAIAAFSVLALGVSEPVLAAYPEKPIKLVIPYRAGGGSDSLARTIQKVVEENKLLPVPLVVTNVDGAAGAVAARQVKDANPDGYTFLQMHNGMLALAATGRLGFGPDAYTPVAQTTQACIYLAVPASTPWKTFDAFVKDAKANPHKYKTADAVGDITHFTWVQLMKATGIDVGIVQAGGTAKRFASMKGGHTQAAFMSPGWISRGGDELRGLLWLGPKRHPAAPDLPTAKEAGIDVVSCLNRRYWAPKATPPDRVAYFADVLKRALATETLKTYHQKQLSDIVFRTGTELENDIKVEMAGYRDAAPAVKAAMGEK